jgi:hypothetical protein
MIYHIYLDGEKQGELTLAEYNRLKRESRSDARTWGAAAVAFLKGGFNTGGRVVRTMGVCGGVAVLTAMFFAPQIYQAVQTAVADGAVALSMAETLRTVGVYVGVGAVSAVVLAEVFNPPGTLQAVFDGEFHRRIRAMKQIRRYGQIEVLGYEIPNSSGEQ